MAAGYYFSMAGLALDLVGAAFLSVEAIKLKNLARVRDRVFVPLHGSLKPIPIRVVEDDEPATPRSACLSTFSAWFLFHLGGGLVLLGAITLAVSQIFEINMLREALAVGMTFPWWGGVLYYGLGGPFAVVLITIGPGEWMHILLHRASSAAVEGLHWIDRRTPDGTIGVIGFLLLISGFASQMIGTHLSS